MSTPSRDQPNIMPSVQQPADLPMEPLGEADARRAEAEALQRTVETSQEASEARRRGRVEAETRRVSEEVTQQAQARLRLERLRQEQSTTPSTGGDDERRMATDDLRDDVEVAASDRALPEPIAIERVLVPLDGTLYAERALPYSLALATWANASVFLAHVRERDPGRARVAFSRALEGTPPETPVHSEQDAAAYLDAMRERVRAIVPSIPRVETITLSADTAAGGLMAITERTNADVVVLATHARQGLERRILGSVGDQFIQNTHVPVLFIPPGLAVPTEQPLQPPKFRRVLIPLDGSAFAEQALAPVLALARCVVPDDPYGMEIVLYYVAESQITRPDGARYVEEVCERLHGLGLPASVSVTATALVGSPPGSITSAAVHGVISEPSYPRRFDLVAMATHGRGGFQRWLYGSVAEYVLSRVAVPTVLVHPKRPDM